MPRDAELSRSRPSRVEHIQMMSHPKRQPLQQQHQVANFGPCRSNIASAFDADRDMELSPRSTADAFDYGGYSAFNRRTNSDTTMSSQPPTVLAPGGGTRTKQCTTFAPTNSDFTTTDMEHGRPMVSPSGWSHVVDASEYHARPHVVDSTWRQLAPASYSVRHPASGRDADPAASSVSVAPAQSRRGDDEAFISFQPAATVESDQRPSLQQWLPTNDRDCSLVAAKVTPSTSVGERTKFF